tara:strand:+ start:355 stop:471 length:117 start_codon:yes stop_codon:yes gene_type:complete
MLAKKIVWTILVSVPKSYKTSVIASDAVKDKQKLTSPI